MEETFLNDLWLNFKTGLQDSSNKHIPFKMMKWGNNKTFMNHHLEKVLEKQKKLCQQKKTSRLQHDKAVYDEYCPCVRRCQILGRNVAQILIKKTKKRNET